MRSTHYPSNETPTLELPKVLQASTPVLQEVLPYKNKQHNRIHSIFAVGNAATAFPTAFELIL